jgi:hypothetical protein
MVLSELGHPWSWNISRSLNIAAGRKGHLNLAAFRHRIPQTERPRILQTWARQPYGAPVWYEVLGGPSTATVRQSRMRGDIGDDGFATVPLIWLPISV